MKNALGLSVTNWSRLVTLIAVVLAISIFGSNRAFSQDFKPIFDGKTLEGWTGDPELWSVQAGVIVGSTDDKQISKNTFLATEKEYGDFVLRVKFKLRNHNSGVQFRSQCLDDYVVRGYQADIAEQRYTGIIYSEGTGRGILADVDPMQINEFYKVGEWNEYEITAKGNRLTLKLNGHQTVDFVDEDKENAANSGIIALQLHTGPKMRVEFKDLEIQELTGSDGVSVDKD